MKIEIVLVGLLVDRAACVNPATNGVNRGTERLVTGSDGSAYYTNDQYTTFATIRGAGG